jgi:hypothetical protein
METYFFGSFRALPGWYSMVVLYILKVLFAHPRLRDVGEDN